MRVATARTEQAYRKRLMRVLEHLLSHLDEPVDPTRLARLAWLSPFHLQRVCRGVVGESIGELVRRVLLERAAPEACDLDPRIDSSLMVLRIKIATDADAAQVATLIAESFAEQVRILGIRRDEFPNYVGFETEGGVSRRLTFGAHVVLAYLAEELIGTVSCTHSAASQVGEILRLAVLPQYRGNGYGRELMQHAENHLATSGARIAELSIVAQFTRLEIYYEGLGYSTKDLRRVQSLPFELRYMQKDLTAGRYYRAVVGG